MIDMVPHFAAVYHRANAREAYTFSRLWKTAYHKAIPETLTVTDLRQYTSDILRCTKCQADAPLLIFVTGDRAITYTMNNWSQTKTSVMCGLSQFPPAPEGAIAGADMDEGWVFIPVFGSLVCFPDDDAAGAARGSSRKRSRPLHAACAPIQAYSIALPPVLEVEDLPGYRKLFRNAFRRVARTDLWLTKDAAYAERDKRPRALARLRCQEPDSMH